MKDKMYWANLKLISLFDSSSHSFLDILSSTNIKSINDSEKEYNNPTKIIFSFRTKSYDKNPRVNLDFYFQDLSNLSDLLNKSVNHFNDLVKANKTIKFARIQGQSKKYIHFTFNKNDIKVSVEDINDSLNNVFIHINFGSFMSLVKLINQVCTNYFTICTNMINICSREKDKDNYNKFVDSIENISTSIQSVSTRMNKLNIVLDELSSVVNELKDSKVDIDDNQIYNQSNSTDYVDYINFEENNISDTTNNNGFDIGDEYIDDENVFTNDSSENENKEIDNDDVFSIEELENGNIEHIHIPREDFSHIEDDDVRECMDEFVNERIIEHFDDVNEDGVSNTPKKNKVKESNATNPKNLPTKSYLIDYKFCKDIDKLLSWIHGYPSIGRGTVLRSFSVTNYFLKYDNIPFEEKRLVFSNPNLLLKYDYFILQFVKYKSLKFVDDDMHTSIPKFYGHYGFCFNKTIDKDITPNLYRLTVDLFTMAVIEFPLDYMAKKSNHPKHTSLHCFRLNNLIDIMSTFVYSLKECDKEFKIDVLNRFELFNKLGFFNKVKDKYYNMAHSEYDEFISKNGIRKIINAIHDMYINENKVKKINNENELDELFDKFDIYKPKKELTHVDQIYDLIVETTNSKRDPKLELFIQVLRSRLDDIPSTEIYRDIVIVCKTFEELLHYIKKYTVDDLFYSVYKVIREIPDKEISNYTKDDVFDEISKLNNKQSREQIINEKNVSKPVIDPPDEMVNDKKSNEDEEKEKIKERENAKIIEALNKGLGEDDSSIDFKKELPKEFLDVFK